MLEIYESRSKEYARYIESYLKALYSTRGGEPQKQLFEAMNYSLLAGGKRLRPIFVFDFCRMCAGSWEQAAPFAAALEMIHTYSLIHDDLPCMDNDDLRRGKPTNHKVYGEAVAVLAGDALLTDAFGVAARAKLPQQKQLALAIETLANCAGSMGMVGGQMLDIQSEQRICTEQEVLDIQSRKTGALIKAACVLGAISGGASDEQLTAAAAFADALGLAFQIRDDMLDVIGDPQLLGKATGTDTVKNTFVSLYGLERCEALVQKYTAEAISQLSFFADNAYMAALAQMLTARSY